VESISAGSSPAWRRHRIGFLYKDPDRSGGRVSDWNRNRAEPSPATRALGDTRVLGPRAVLRDEPDVSTRSFLAPLVIGFVGADWAASPGTKPRLGPWQSRTGRRRSGDRAVAACGGSSPPMIVHATSAGALRPHRMILA